MLSVKIDETNGIAILEPEDALTENDFVAARAVIDPFIENKGNLRGVIIHTKSFPGWDSFGALLSHLTFVKDHHNKISSVAFVTDSVLGGFAEMIGSHFVNAKIKMFSFEELEKAKSWILDNHTN